MSRKLKFSIFLLLLLKVTKKKRKITDFIPKSHTCSNTLHLPCGSATIPMPPDEDLFAIYDLAFKNSYFGIM